MGSERRKVLSKSKRFDLRPLWLFAILGMLELTACVTSPHDNGRGLSTAREKAFDAAEEAYHQED